MIVNMVEFREKLKKANECLKVHGNDGNWNHDDYMVGYYNGMELIISLMEERETNFRELPEKDKEKDGKDTKKIKGRLKQCGY